MSLDSNSTNPGYVGLIYAPDTAIQVNSNGNLRGAMRGKYVSVQSRAHFIYDEDLSPPKFSIILKRELV